MLRDDWNTTCPEFLPSEFGPGRYVLVDEMDDAARVAEWEELAG